MKQLLFLIVVSGTLLAQSPTKHVSGQIKGTVIDQDGSPVSFATVYAVPQGLTLDDVTPHSVKADGNGAFDFHGGLEFRSYKLYSRKDADGYLNPLDAFYADGEYRPVEVALSRGQPSAAVIVKLGKQAAVISGKIMDAKSGTPLKAYLGVLDEEGNGHSVVVEGDYNVVVPSERNVTLMVTVLGTRRSLVPVSHFRLEPGQRVFMDIPISAAEKE
jgi:hypothetical protein